MSLAFDLTRRLGGDWRGDAGFIPSPGHSKRDRGTVVRDRSDGRGVVVHSFNADWRDVRDALGLSAAEARPMTAAESRKLKADLAKAKAEREKRQFARCLDLVRAGSAPEPGSPVRTYLRERGIPASAVALAVSAGALLEHSDERGRFSMLALAHDRAGRLRACQLTKLRADGSGKRGKACDRLTFGPYKGSACRLFKLAGDTLAVAEGVETALAFNTLRKIPTWATFGSVNLKAFDPPPGVRRLYIAADGDAPGAEAAQALFDRLRDRVRVVIAAAPDGMDWADVLASKRRGAHVIG